VIRVAGRGNEYDIFRAEREAPSVMAAIRAYDPALLVGWDSSACRWSLLRVSRGGYHYLGVIETDDKRCRPLDMRVLEDLRRWDLWRGAKSATEDADRMDREDDEREKRSWDDFNDDISHATRENRRQLNRLAKLAGL